MQGRVNCVVDTPANRLGPRGTRYSLSTSPGSRAPTSTMACSLTRSATTSSSWRGLRWLRPRCWTRPLRSRSPISALLLPPHHGMHASRCPSACLAAHAQGKSGSKAGTSVGTSAWHLSCHVSGPLQHDATQLMALQASSRDALRYGKHLGAGLLAG